MGSMGRTESIFAGILLAAVIVAVLVVVLKNDAKPVDPSETFNNTEAEIGTPAVRFTGVDSEDLCICYEQAYAYGAKKGKSGITSDVYRGGYQACASRLPAEGGNAWTWGWANGMNGPGTPKSCRGYYAQKRSNEAN